MRYHRPSVAAPVAAPAAAAVAAPVAAPVAAAVAAHVAAAVAAAVAAPVAAAVAAAVAAPVAAFPLWRRRYQMAAAKPPANRATVGDGTMTIRSSGGGVRFAA